MGQLRSSWKIVSDFGDTEVRKKSEGDLPPCFREWESVPDKLPLTPPKWPKQTRRVNTLGYPPFDIFSEWLMDFASVAAHHLKRSDWQNFRRMLLVHAPDCPLSCWYCFNDAWRGKEGLSIGSPTPEEGEEAITASDIVNKFESYRERFAKAEGYQVNMLRISGGEPFGQAGLVGDIAREFTRTQGAFLWVDTNLVPFTRDDPGRFNDDLHALKELGQRAAIHACLHGVGPESFKRNSGAEVRTDEIQKALSGLVNFGLHVYPRINPVGLTPEETAQAFRLMKRVCGELPARTYLGMLELQYDAVAKRMAKAGEGRSTIPSLNPSNGSVFVWNRMMEETYGIGYGVVPRTQPVVPLNPCRDEYAEDVTKDWHAQLLLIKGWSKEGYARKLLELLALPGGAEIEVEYENRWVDPVFLGHVWGFGEQYSDCPKHKIDVDVMVLAGPAGGSGLVPLRKGKLIAAWTSSPSDARHSLNLRIAVGDYVATLGQPLAGDAEELLEKLATMMGARELPPSRSGRYCKYAALQVAPMLQGCDSVGEDREHDCGFRAVVLSMMALRDANARPDIYYRVEVGLPARTSIKDGRLIVREGCTLRLDVHAFNPNLGNPGYPTHAQAQLDVLSTEPETVVISPARIRLSKYGHLKVHVGFPREGHREGNLILRSSDSSVRMAEVTIPYRVVLEEDRR
ncbi:MAG: radical SAM protein [Planctomycetota bacterium]|jgi:uncharacterized Fe-S cluster-containing radical SAM superfamily protein